MASHARLVSVVVALLVASCGSEPADVAGRYTVNLTNGANGCMTMDWMEGATTMGVVLEITQDGSNFTADVTDVGSRAWLDIAVGSHTFTGTVSGTHLDGLLRGRAGSTGTCAYTLNVELDADLDGDLITGTLRWYADANDSPDCGMYATCSNAQSFNGVRPPS